MCSRLELDQFMKEPKVNKALGVIGSIIISTTVSSVVIVTMPEYLDVLRAMDGGS